MLLAGRIFQSYTLYAATIFLSAFLLFVIQPIVAKHLLPYFGGSSSVWATSLAFFTTMLFLGYAYVYLLTRYAPRHQTHIHAMVAGGTCAITIGTLAISHTFFPLLDWTVGSTQAPALNVLVALMLAIGSQYFLLATTGPLLQYWWGSASKAEPYKLYALSNVASLLALIGYPFVIEPLVSLAHEALTWALLFILYSCICVGISMRHRITESPDVVMAPTPSARTLLSWIGLAALPAYLLVATTTTLTQVIAPVPLLWVLPLALYLTTFILAFRGWGQSIFMAPVVLGTAWIAYTYTSTSMSYIPLHVASYVLVLFAGGLLSHGWLYRNRPTTANLPLFYLLIACGGMLGTLASSIVAPLLFVDFYEFPIGVTAAALLAIWISNDAVFPRAMLPRHIHLTRIVFSACALVLLMRTITMSDGVLTIYSRNFYGPAQVRFTDALVSLVHGTTLHGFQTVSKEWQSVPTSYYVPASGLGRAMIYERDLRSDQGELRIGTIGLGTGSIASYCTPDDEFVFYEIDPRIESLARSYFSYLANCKNATVRIGDGRLLLAEELHRNAPGEYDILVLDAFSDDTVPAHLLTTEALRLYASHLRSDKSIIALHISNRFLDLAPMVFRGAAETGLNAMIVRDDGDFTNYSVPSTWVLLTKNADVFHSVIFAHTDSTLPDTKHAPLWTDDYSSILPVLDVRALLVIPE